MKTAGCLLISVVIPCYNYARYLPDAVESVMRQTYPDWEIIIVNDGSTDDSREVASRLIAQYGDRTIQLINQENTGHPALSRNRGIAVARGDYILPLDADDMIEPTMLAECMSVLESDESVSFVYTDRLDFDGTDQIVKAGDYDFEKLKYGNILSYCTLFRRKVWEEVGGYRTVGYEDWNFWVAAGALGHRGFRIPKPLFKYRRHDTGRFQVDSFRHELLSAEIILRNHSLYCNKEIQQAVKVVTRLGSPTNKEFLAYRQGKGPGWLRRLTSKFTGRSLD